MKKVISILLSVLMLVTTCVINPNPIVAEDTEENEKFSFTLLDTGDHFEVSLNKSDNVIDKLKAEIEDINLDEYNPDSFIFFYAYYDGSENENENQFSIINQKDNLDILTNGKKNIDFYAFHSRFVDPTFYCVPIEDFKKDDGEPIFTNICGYNGMTQSINEMVGNEAYGAFYFDYGDQSKPVNPTFSGGSNIEINDVGEQNYIKRAIFLGKSNPEQPAAYFSYTDESGNTHTINIEVSREERNFSMGFYNFEEYEEGVKLNDEENILEQLTRRYNEIINSEYFECGEFDKKSEEFYLSTNNKNILIDENTTLEVLKKNDAKIYVNFTKLNSNQLYCVPCNYENNTINYKTIVNNKKIIYRNINKGIGSEDMLVGFFYGDGSGDDEIRVNNPELSDSSIGFTVSTPDYATDDYSNIRKISFSDICSGRGTFVYENSTLNIDIHPNNDDFFNIYFENGTYQGLNVQFVKKSVGEESLFSYLTSHIIDNDYSGQEFRYFDKSKNDMVVINEETSKDILNTIDSIQVHWNKYIGKDRLFVVSGYFDGQNFVENEPQYSIELLPNNMGMFRFYYGNDNNKTQVPLNELTYNSDYFEIPQDPESNGLYRIMTKSIEGHTAISYNDASLDVNVSLPYVSLYSAPERTIDNFVSNIKETSDVTLYFIWDQSDEKFVINGAFIRESKDNDGPLTNDQFSCLNEGLQNCYKLHFSELPDTGFLVIEYKHENQDDIQEISIMLGQGNNGEGSGTEERNETYEVDNVNDLIEKLDYFKDYANGTIIIKPNQQSDKFIINQDIIIDHVKPDTNHTDASDDEMQNGRNLWLKIILTCDVEITSNANLNITKDSKVIIKSDDLSTQDYTGTQRKITKNGGGTTLNNNGNILLKEILVENTDASNSFTTGINQYGGSLSINDYSKVSAPIGIRVGSDSTYTGVFGNGEIVGTKSYAIYAPSNEDSERKYNEFGIQTNKISTLNANNIVAYIEGDEDKGSFQTREAVGTILVKNGSINIEKITSNDDCIKVEPNTDSKIYITMHQEAISDNGIIIRETVNEGQSSKIQKLIIDNGKYQCKDDAKYSIVLANSPNNVDITSGRFNVKFIDDYKNVHSSWSADKDEEGYYTLTDSRDATAEVSSYADLLTAIKNQNKTISINADLSYTEGQNQEITINHLTDINLNGHTLTGYTFNFNYVQDYKGRIDPIRINNGSLISKGRPVIVTTTATNLHGVIVEDEKDNNEYVRHTGDNLNDYLFEVNGLGMLSLNDCTVNGINAIKLGLAYPDESFERNNSLLEFQKTNITVSDYVIYDDSNPCISRKSGYEMFVGDTEKNEVDCIFKSTNGTAFYLKYLNGTIHNSTIEAKESCVYTCAGGSVSLSINENTTLISDGPTVNAFADTTFNTYLTCKFVSNNDSVFKIQGQGTNSYIQIHDGTFIASKSEEKHVIENKNSRFDSLIQAGRFTHDMNNFKVSRGFECITVDTSNVPYAIARKFNEKKIGEYTVKPYIYANDDFDIDGNSLGDAIGNVDKNISLIFNAKSLDSSEKFGSDNSVTSYYDLFIDEKVNDNTFTPLTETSSLQTVTILLTPQQQEELNGKYALVKYIHNNTIKELLVVPENIGSTSNVPCAYVKDGNKLIIKTQQFCEFALGASDEPFNTVVSKPTLNTNEFELQADNKYHVTYDGKFKTLVLEDSPYYEISGVNSTKNVGTYHVQVSLKDKSLYSWADGTKDDLVYSFAIDKKKIDAPANNTSTFTYNGAVQTYTLTENDAYSINGNEQTNAGNYVVKVSLKDKDHYEWSDNTTEDKQYSFVIAKANGSITTEPSAKSLTYTGQAQELVNAGVSETGTIQYKLGAEEEYSTSIPKATNAGTHTVYYKVVGDANHNDVSEASVKVTIAKAQGSIGNAPTAKELTYTGQAQELVNAGSNATGTIQYKLGAEEEYSTSIPKATNAGTYSIYYKVIDSENYEGVDECATPIQVTIAKAKVTKPIVTTTSFEYDGNAHSLAIAQSDLYTITGNTLTAKGSTNVTVELNDKTNYCWNDDSTDNLTFTLTVTGKVITAPTANNQIFTYSKQAQNYFANTGAGYTLKNNTQTNAGTYTVKAILSDKTNTVWSSGGTNDLEFEFKINKAKVDHPAEDTTSFVYTGSELTYNIPASDLYTVSGNEQTNAGTYPVTVTLTDTDNYEWADEKTYSFVIAKAQGSIGNAPTAKELTYTGQAQELVNAGSNATGTIQYKLGAEGKYSTSIPKATNAGTHTVYYKVVGDANHNDVSEASVEVTIAKKKIDVPPADENQYTYTGNVIKYGVESNEYYTVINNIRKEAGSQEVVITLKDTNNTEWASELGTYTFTIAKAVPDYKAPTGIKVASGSKLSTVTLPNGFKWNNGDEVVNSERDCLATYTPSDTDNYNVITNVNIHVDVVEGAKIEISVDSKTTIDSSSLISMQDQAVEIKSATTYGNLTEEQLSNIRQATNVAVKATITDTQSQDEIDKIKEKVPSNARVLSYLEINLEIVADGNPYKLSESKNSLTFTVSVDLTSLPELVNGKTRQYYVLRNHNGNIDKLPAIMDAYGNLVFSSNLFSTYAIVYEDIIEGGGNSPRYNPPATGIK